MRHPFYRNPDRLNEQKQPQQRHQPMPASKDSIPIFTCCPTNEPGCPQQRQVALPMSLVLFSLQNPMAQPAMLAGLSAAIAMLDMHFLVG